jgi:hypothetical protein
MEGPLSMRKQEKYAQSAEGKARFQPAMEGESFARPAVATLGQFRRLFV